MKNIQKNIILFLIVVLFLLPTFSSVHSLQTDFVQSPNHVLTIDILKIRSLEHSDPQLNVEEIIDEQSNPDFFVVIKTFLTNNSSYTMYDSMFTSEIFWNQKYLYNKPYSVTIEVPEIYHEITIQIALWDAADGKINNDRLCDLSPDTGTNEDAYDAEIVYSFNSGHWGGDDALKDASGYGRLNGCDDGTIYEPDRDCELWFSITQHDLDEDFIPTYMETEVYGTDPLVDDGDIDFDEDGIPTWWEWRYGFDPMTWDDHFTTDADEDGLPTINEYRTCQWFSDPYTRDLFLELDQMEEGPNGEKSIFPEGAKEMLYTAHDRQNVVYHLDDGDGIWTNNSGSEFVPFDRLTSYQELREYYNEYFLHGDTNNWRKEIFHYGILIYESDRVEGMAFGCNCFQISAHLLDLVAESGFDRDVTYASAYMHETGHTLRFWPIPGHGKTGWLLRIFLPLYKSCMSYGWIYRMVDYSDGSRPHLGPLIGDYDDWKRMDMSYFLNA